MTRRELYAGIDLGGTKTLVVISDADGNVMSSKRAPTDAPRGPEAVIARIIETVKAAAGDAGVAVSDLTTAGVSAPGPIDTSAGLITDPPNLPGWHNVPLGRILQERLGLPVILENDANCAAVGEHQYGAGRGFRHLIYITISTGIGGGLIIDNELYAGASGAAGEVGHIGVTVEGPACGAGHPGCLEAYSAGSGIAARARELVAAGQLPLTEKLAAASPPLSARTVAEAAQQGEAGAAALIERAARYFGVGLASVINIFNPQAVIIGGGLTKMGDILLGPAIETARGRAFAQSFDDVRILEWQLGDQVSALGAVAIARKRMTVGTP